MALLEDIRDLLFDNWAGAGAQPDIETSITSRGTGWDSSEWIRVIGFLERNYTYITPDYEDRTKRVSIIVNTPDDLDRLEVLTNEARRILSDIELAGYDELHVGQEKSLTDPKKHFYRTDMTLQLEEDTAERGT